MRHTPLVPAGAFFANAADFAGGPGGSTGITRGGAEAEGVAEASALDDDALDGDAFFCEPGPDGEDATPQATLAIIVATTPTLNRASLTRVM
jgi:hypothetical protein